MFCLKKAAQVAPKHYMLSYDTSNYLQKLRLKQLQL